MAKSLVWKGEMLSAGMNAKTSKGDAKGEYATAILYLAPANLAGGATMCSMAVIARCVYGCLNTSGRGAFNNVQQARIRKTKAFKADRDGFMATLVRDVIAFRKWCAKHGVKPAIRLNGTSDVMWERIAVGNVANIMEMFPDVQFYDYTKIAKRCRSDYQLPANYRLTMSYSGANAWFAGQAEDVLKDGGNLAVVFRDKATRDRYMTEGWNGFTVIDGDETDLRFLDPRNVVVGLYAKGRAKADDTGFVVD